MAKHSLSEHEPVKVHVRRLDDRKIVHSVEVKEPCARKIELVVRGLLRNMSDEYFVDDSEGDRYYR
jgi:hypothetical protein